MLFTGKQEIVRMSLDADDMVDVVIPLQQLHSVVACDWDSRNDHIYWTDMKTRSISTARWDGAGQRVSSSLTVSVYTRAYLRNGASDGCGTAPGNG